MTSSECRLEMEVMYKNRASDGMNNICGRKVRKFREALPSSPSQRGLADLLQLEGLDIDKNGVIKLPHSTLAVLDLQPGMELLSIRSSDIAFTMGAKGPLLQKAHNFQGSIEKY